MLTKAFLSYTLLSVALAAENDVRLGNDVIYDGGFPSEQQLLNLPCPEYTRYAKQHHEPVSEGPLELPFQRPHPNCRKFTAPEVEQVIEDLYSSLMDRDLAQIFRNAFPNTLDTTVSWHVDGEKTHAAKAKSKRNRKEAEWKGAQSFIVTGDINAEWLRDSTNQLAQYQALASTSPAISNLLKGAIATQAEFIIESPYCNAFQPPDPSGLNPTNNGQGDTVHPVYEPSIVFECKYELDSLANFLSIGNQYFSNTGSHKHLTNRWFLALRTILLVLEAQSRPTFDDASDRFMLNQYNFRRWTDAGTETLNLRGVGNPIANGTGLVRSAFRPSDDATILPFLIPANAMMAVELEHTAVVLKDFVKGILDVQDKENVEAYIKLVTDYAKTIREGVMRHGVVDHPIYGKVLAYEVDGYGSHILMDDANVPSLLSLPLLGFMNQTDTLYQSTRKMILSKSNPYFLQGSAFTGIGGPHIGPNNAWPMSVLVQAMTTDDDEEIMRCLERVKSVSVFGLINESVDVHSGVNAKTATGMTRSWFAWANSVFAQCVLWLAAEKPHLVFPDGTQRYTLRNGFEPVASA